jgi:hypothetical protein
MPQKFGGMPEILLLYRDKKYVLVRYHLRRLG